VLARDRREATGRISSLWHRHLEDGVDLVIRGMDLLPSTGRQNRVGPAPRPTNAVGVPASPLVLALVGES